MNMRPPFRSRGAVIVEFALVVMILLLLVFGLIELGRALWKWNSAVDATRRGARTAAIVAIGDNAAIIQSMHEVFPDLDADLVTVEYSADGHFPPSGACVRGTCRFVRVGIEGYSFAPVIFFLPSEIAMPHIAATYPVESLGAT